MNTTDDETFEGEKQFRSLHGFSIIIRLYCASNYIHTYMMTIDKEN